MTGLELFATIGALCAALGGLLRVTRAPVIRLGGLALLLASWATLIVAIAPESIRDRWPLLIAVGVVALFGGWLLAARALGHERWLLAAGALVLTLRVPIPIAGDHVMLLAPLYIVIAFGALVVARRDWAALRSAPINTTRSSGDGAARAVELAVKVLPALGAISIIWSIDRMGSAENLAFFYVPFLLLFALVRAWVSSLTDLRGAAWALVGAAVVAATVGLVQAATNEVWWNPKVIGGNRFRSDFRVNSIFWDPNVYGRALVVAALIVVAWLLVGATRTRLQRIGGVLTLGLLLLALWHTYSQSSWFALAAAAAALALLSLPTRPRRFAAVALAILLAIGIAPALHQLAGADVDGRGSVAELGLELFQEHPIVGTGVGSFAPAATRQALDDGIAHPKLVDSHATPITVLAELGMLGGLAYALLLGSAIAATIVRWRTVRPLAPVIWATAAIVAITAHSMLYAGFFEDATLWVALAVLVSTPARSPDHAR